MPILHAKVIHLFGHTSFGMGIHIVTNLAKTKVNGKNNGKKQNDICNDLFHGLETDIDELATIQHDEVQNHTKQNNINGPTHCFFIKKNELC